MITIAIPVLNEEPFIEACLKSLIEQIDAATTEIFVIDGGSSDRTLEIVSDLREDHPCIRILHNPKRIQAAAINLASRKMSSRSQVLIRADAHAVYPPDFVELCVSALVQHQATSVVVPMQTVGLEPFQHAVAAVQNSLLGNGGAAHRTGRRSGFVDHGHHAAFRPDFFRELGGYDESFTHNEDAEFDHRAVAAGGRIWMCRDAVVKYFPRNSLAGLARQYYNHGRGRGRTLARHRSLPKLRQMVPVAAFLSAVLALLLMPVEPSALAMPLIYLGACALFSLVLALRRREASLLAAGPAAVTMHMSWAVGFLRSLIEFWPLRRTPSGLHHAASGTMVPSITAARRRTSRQRDREAA